MLARWWSATRSRFTRRQWRKHLVGSILFAVFYVFAAWIHPGGSDLYLFASASLSANVAWPIAGEIFAEKPVEPPTDHHELTLVATGPRGAEVAEILHSACGLTDTQAKDTTHRAPVMVRFEATTAAAAATTEALRRAGAIVQLRVLEARTADAGEGDQR